jgi:hypothetical protein
LPRTSYEFFLTQMLKHQRGSFESSRKIELQPRNKIGGGQKSDNFISFNHIQADFQNEP